MNLRDNIPSFIYNSGGRLHDVHALDMLLPEPGAIYVMGRGYIDFARLHVLHQTGAFFVTWAKSNLDAHRIYSAPTRRTTGVICDICDRTIAPDGYLAGRCRSLIQVADSDEAARVNRALSAHRSDLMPPIILI